MRYVWIIFSKVSKRNINIFTLFLFIFYSFIIVIFNISLKIYEINKIVRIKESIISNIIVSFMSMGFFGVFFYFTQIKFARFVFFSGFLCVPIILSVLNKFLFFILNKTKKPFTLLYTGDKQNFELFNELIDEYSKWFNINFDFVFYDDNPEILNAKIMKCNYLIVDSDNYCNNFFQEIINNFELSGGKIYSLVDIFSYLDQSLPAEIVKNTNYSFFTSYKINSIYNKIFKRIMDIIISVMLLIILSPVIFISMILIKITSSGSILYSQKRVTIRNKIFNIYKFRTMKINTPGTNKSIKSPEFTIKNDKRITFIGKILRPLRIDEIPQLFNILKGDMSFIGPRPERPELIDKITLKYPLFKKRQLIKPGLTGWAQVKYTYVNDINNMNKKLSYDLYYINNLSFLFDLKILLYTFETIIFRRGAI